MGHGFSAAGTRLNQKPFDLHLPAVSPSMFITSQSHRTRHCWPELIWEDQNSQFRLRFVWFLGHTTPNLTVNYRLSVVAVVLYSLDLLVDDDAYSMLCDIINPSRFAVVALVRHAFLNGSCALWTKKLADIRIWTDCRVPLCTFKLDYYFLKPFQWQSTEKDMRHFTKDVWGTTECLASDNRFTVATNFI